MKKMIMSSYKNISTILVIVTLLVFINCTRKIEKEILSKEVLLKEFEKRGTKQKLVVIYIRKDSCYVRLYS